MANIELTKEQQQMAVGGVLMLAAFGYVYYAFFWAPIAAEIADARTQIESIEKDLAKAKSVAGTLESIKKEIANLEFQMAEAEKRLPRKKEVADIVDTLNDLGKRTRVNLISIVPGPTKTQPLFIEVPYSLQLEGSYHTIARFLAALAISERIFNERGVALSKGSAGLTANFTLLAYQYRDQSAQAAQPAAKPSPKPPAGHGGH